MSGSQLIKLIYAFIKSIILISIVTLVVGLLLPQQYKIDKTIVIEAPPSQLQALISDFKQWPKWSPWQKVAPDIKFSLGNPNAGVGAHQFWQNRWGSGEMTITDITPSKIGINILFNQEHIADGNISFIKEKNTTILSCQLIGEVNTPIVGGYLALLNKYILTNSVKMGLNNLKTTTQINPIELDEKTDEYKSSASKD